MRSTRLGALFWLLLLAIALLLGLALPPAPWRGAGEDKLREPDRAHPAIVDRGQGCTGG